eukprot:scaffold386512_cov42-Prasinocladus_malaysianus.AAC.1
MPDEFLYVSFSYDSCIIIDEANSANSVSAAQPDTVIVSLKGQIYNGKHAKQFGRASSDACRLCGLPDSCTHIGGECHANHCRFISRHNAAVQL